MKNLSVRHLMLTGLLALILVGPGGCRQDAVDLELRSTEWELVEAYSPYVADTVNGLLFRLTQDSSWLSYLGPETNLLPVFQEPLLEMPDTTWSYRVFLEDGGVASGLYFLADTLHQAETGSWELRDADLLYMNLGPFVNGEFKLTKLDKNYWQMKTDDNLGRLQYDALEIELQSGLELRMYMN